VGFELGSDPRGNANPGAKRLTGGFSVRNGAEVSVARSAASPGAIDSADDLARKWPGILAARSDFIKIYLLYSEEFAKRRDDPACIGWKGLDPALVPLIVQRAKDAGLRVAAHVETASDFRAAVRGGVAEIAHLPGVGGAPTSAGIGRSRIIDS
jgi:hypothetical protein